MVGKLTAVEIIKAMKIGLSLAKQNKPNGTKPTNHISTVPIQTRGPLRIATRGQSDLIKVAQNSLREEFEDLGINLKPEVIEGLAKIVAQAA